MAEIPDGRGSGRGTAVHLGDEARTRFGASAVDAARQLTSAGPSHDEPEGDEPVLLVTGGMAYAAEAAAHAARLPGDGLDRDLTLDPDLGPYETETYMPQLGPL